MGGQADAYMDEDAINAAAIAAAVVAADDARLGKSRFYVDVRMFCPRV